MSISIDFHAKDKKMSAEAVKWDEHEKLSQDFITLRISTEGARVTLFLTEEQLKVIQQVTLTSKELKI